MVWEASLMGIAAVLLVGAEQTAHVPNCPPDPRKQDAPEALYTFNGLTREGYDRADQFLREIAPNWIEQAHSRTAGSSALFEGDIAMGYFNHLNYARGYALKLEFLAADDNERSAREKDFCDFTLRAVAID